MVRKMDKMSKNVPPVKKSPAPKKAFVLLNRDGHELGRYVKIDEAKDRLVRPGGTIQSLSAPVRVWRYGGRGKWTKERG